ncbi:MAG TPA: histidine phosphatase family protein [Arachnia sp.]|jgi:broad specificity phosphatase PhoE|nr:histidine phosphatase family protein [Arachnia sp.]
MIEGTTLVVLRHGQTDLNASGRFQGQADIPLNAVGIAQAEAARRRLAGVTFDAVYSSPLSRALDTARLIRPDADIATDPRLMEIDVGSWSGRTWDEVKAEMPDYERHYANGVDFRRSATGETLAEVVARGLPATEEIARRHPGGLVLVVAHGLLLNRVIHALLGLEGRVLGGLGNAHHSELLFTHGAWRLQAHNVS